MNRIKGILYAAVSSSTFGLAPFFSLTLLLAGFSAFEVLSYRWGVATIALTLFGWCSGCSFRLEKKDFFSCSFIKFVEGSYFIQFAYSISEYSYRGGVNHSFYVSVGGISSHDVLLSGKEIPLGDVCGLHVLVRSGLAFIGGTRGEKW